MGVIAELRDAQADEEQSKVPLVLSLRVVGVSAFAVTVLGL